MVKVKDIYKTLKGRTSFLYQGRPVGRLFLDSYYKLWYVPIEIKEEDIMEYKVSKIIPTQEMGYCIVTVVIE